MRIKLWEPFLEASLITKTSALGRTAVQSWVKEFLMVDVLFVEKHSQMCSISSYHTGRKSVNVIDLA